ncbi:MAG TPA: DUF1697 domain-containing protein [Arenimonas sp.]|nr:DUF1697 domain-containing protein [Arenimonas sp.]
MALQSERFSDTASAKATGPDSTMKYPKHIALLRGINVGGNNKIPMSGLCAMAESLGWRDVRHYIQSGNLVFAATGTRTELESALEAGIRAHFGLTIPVLVRSASDWRALAAANPMAELSAADPARVMLCLSKQPPANDAGTALKARAINGERVTLQGGALWIHYPNGAGTSKLSPSLMDRLTGSPVTARNWRTVEALLAMLE